MQPLLVAAPLSAFSQAGLEAEQFPVDERLWVLWVPLALMVFAMLGVAVVNRVGSSGRELPEGVMAVAELNRGAIPAPAAAGKPVIEGSEAEDDGELS